MARLDDGTRVNIPCSGAEPEDEDRIVELLAYANRKTADKLCENCKWHEDFLGVCFNGESEHRADFTTSGFSCDQWEAMDENGK